MQLVRIKAIRYIMFLLVLAGTVYFLYLVREVVVSFLIGGLVAYLLYRPVQFFEDRGMKRLWSIISVYAIFLFLTGLVLWFAIPGLTRQLTDAAKLLPAYADQAQVLYEKIDGIELPGQMEQIVRENKIKIENVIYQGLRGLAEGIYTLFSKAYIIIFAPILAFYILKDWEKIRDRILKAVSPGTRADILLVSGEIDQVLVEFFKGHLLVCLFVGAFTGLAAAILGVKFSLIIGIIAGITNLVPYFGPFLGGIPAVGLALSQSFRAALYMAAAILVIQQVESNFITPKIIGERLGMHPLLIVFALLAGGKLFGVWGMIFAVPMTAVLKIVFVHVYLKMLES